MEAQLPAVRAMYSPDSDDALVERALKGDMSAFSRLYDRYEKPLFNFICQYVGDYEAAQDVFQETFIRAYRKLQRYQLGTNFSAWLHRIAINQSKDEFKRRRRRPISSITQSEGGEETDLLATISDESLTPEELLTRKEQAGRVRRALTRLTKDHMQVILLYVFQGMAYKDIADTLGIPIGTVKSRMHYAIKELGKVLDGRL